MTISATAAELHKAKEESLHLFCFSSQKFCCIFCNISLKYYNMMKMPGVQKESTKIVILILQNACKHFITLIIFYILFLFAVYSDEALHHLTARPCSTISLSQVIP